jgi:DeoR/GlpR family transcriptional regulator of sugar metabolism
MLDYAAFPEQRQSLIRDLLCKEGRVVCVKLSQELQVSEHTIRRDLQELARAGVCKRVYGGAVGLSPASGCFAQRRDQGVASKALLGQAGAQLIRDGGCIFIDAGTTNLAVAKAIPPELSLTVVTNAPSIAAEVMNLPRCEIIMLGGRIQARTGAALGATPLNQAKDMHFDQCFLGACAVDPEQGLTVFDYEDAEFKRGLVRQNNELIVVLTSDKIPSIARYKVMSCQEISVLVVDNDMPRDKVAALIEQGVDVRFSAELI